MAHANDTCMSVTSSCAASAASDDTRPPRVTIMSLPPELLIMTFEHIHAPLVEVREKIRDSHTPIGHIEDINERITRGKTFPYPYVDVCRHWGAVILNVPRFWTNAIVFIGPLERVYGKHLGGAETIFGASRTLPFDVTIRSAKPDSKLGSSRSPSTLEWLGDELECEQADIVHILKLLVPHLHRCRSLSLYTLLVGAMSLVYRHLDGPAPLLKMLMLQTNNMHSINSKPSFCKKLKLQSGFSPLTSTFAPPLEQLIVDGTSFRDVHKHHTKTCETYGAGLVSLALVNYVGDAGQDDGYSPLRASAMAQALTRLEYLHALKLSRMYFDEEDNDELEYTQLGVRALFLECMDNYALEQLFTFVAFPDLEQLWVKGCWPEYEREGEFDPADLPLHVPLLTLESVEGVDLARGLRYWDVLTIRTCRSPAFDDVVLDMLGTPHDPELTPADIDEWTDFGCDALRTLVIHSTPGISTAALKRMVTSRNRWVDYADPMWRTSVPAGPAIEEIHLWQLPGQMVFTAEDEAWFHAHVARFRFGWAINEDLRNTGYVSELDFHASH